VTLPGPWSRLALVLLSVVLTLLALPGQPYPLLAFVSLMPLGLALHGASRGSGALLGFTFGLLGWLGSLGGLATAAQAYLQLSPLAAALYVAAFCAYSALPYALFAYLYGVFQWLRRPFGTVLTAAFFSLLVCLFPSPMPMSPEAALYPLLGFIQILDLGGRPLLLFVLALVNWSLAGLLLRYLSGVRFTGIAVSLAIVVALVLGYGHVRLSSLAVDGNTGAQGKLTVATLQPDLPLLHDVDRDDASEPGNLDVLMAMSQQVLITHPSVSLIVWPETPERIDCGAGAASRDELLDLARRHGTSIIVSCAEGVPHRGDYNTSMLVSPDGQIITYHKQILFPFAEFLPGESSLPVLRSLLPEAANYLGGEADVLMPLPADVRAFSAICYEVLFSAHVWKFVQRGGAVLVNPVNDAWFGNSRIAHFMVAAAVFRAVEFRLPVVRVSNSSDSLVVGRSGRIAAASRIPAGQSSFRVNTIADIGGKTPGYFPARIVGAVLGLICLAGLIASLRKVWGV
jgi:apolipoprotein N-acyltransferase